MHSAIIVCKHSLLKMQSHYSVWHQRMIIRSQTQIYVTVRSRQTSCTFLITLTYVSVRCYTQMFKYCFEHVHNFSAYASVLIIRFSYAQHTLGIGWIRLAYAEYARHTLEVRYSYVGTCINGGQLSSKYIKGPFSPLSSDVDRSSSLTPFWFNNLDTILY